MQRGRTRSDVATDMLSYDRTLSAAERQARANAQSQIFGLFLERNQRGSEAEQQGNLDAAIELFEANLVDGFTGQHSYDRLRIIYTKRKDWPNVIRVCRAYLAIPNTTEAKRAKFEKALIKAEAK